MEKFLKSRYKIGELIGENPFSITYKGYLIGTQVPVVIKIYKRAALNSPLINKLRPKVTKIISLDHPNIARVIDGDYGWQGFYFIREFVEGESLKEMFAKGVPEMPAALEIMKQVLSSVATAHKENLIHGAITTSNIFIAGGGEVKVTDFILEPGVRKSPELLAEAAATGSSFMSPEQIKGEQIGVTSDIYSLGILFYQLLTGRSPFNGVGGLDTALGHITEIPLPPSQLSSSIPQYLDDIILKMLEKDPLQRISRIEDVLESMNKHRLIFRAPDQDYVDLIYEDNLNPIVYDEEVVTKKEKPKTKWRKISRRSLFSLLVLISIAVGLWLAFIVNFVSLK